MRKARLLSIGVVLATSVMVLAALAAGEVEVQVAPHTLLLSSEQSGRVTVHVDIPYWVVVEDTVTLGNEAGTVPAVGSKADDCGDFVGFFDEAQVKDLFGDRAPDVSFEDLTLSGSTTDGAAFGGTDTVQVMN
jgi:hypothetical protein